MTGSGKTGLGIGLLEEAAIDGVPVIAIDPKGDLGNLLLTFPELRARGFRALDQSAGRRGERGQSPEDYAEKPGRTMAEGSRGLGTGRRAHCQPEECGRVRASSRPAATPGDPVSVLASLAAPPRQLIGDAELYRRTRAGDRYEPAGAGRHRRRPVHSREHILVSPLLDRAWRAGRDLDLAGLIARHPEAAARDGRRAGARDASSRRRTASSSRMQLNNLLAAPGFDAWLQGTPLDVQGFLYTATGKPQVSVMSIAHLDDAVAHVLRDAAPERARRLDADAAGHVEPARHPLHGRDLRLPAAGREPALEETAADAAQAGAGLWPRTRARHTESGRPRLQGAVQHRHLVHRPTADGARHGASDGRPRRGRQRELRPAGDGAHAGGPRQSSLPAAQRARGRARRCSRPAGRCPISPAR